MEADSIRPLQLYLELHHGLANRAVVQRINDQWADGFDFHPPIELIRIDTTAWWRTKPWCLLTKRFVGWVPSATKEGTHPVVSPYARLCSVNTEQRRALCEGKKDPQSFLPSCCEQLGLMRIEPSRLQQ